jgi:serine/tyrosine/threonine adenylyltransferase
MSPPNFPVAVALQNSYAQLPDRFFSHVVPTPVTAPKLVQFNEPLAAQLGVACDLSDPDAIAQVFSGNRLLPDSIPIAMAYAGHQFGHFVPQLGDGRAILMGEARDRQQAPFDIQLKGAGRTPYSRGGDGRAALGPVLREYVVSEAMTALKVPSTRSLAAVTSGEDVFREEALPGAILTRVAASHVRVGTFQYFAARSDTDAVRTLADFVIQRHYPHLAGSSTPYLGLLGEVMRRQALLVAKWLQVGFIHGVMNTDNTSVSGETIDFGPCAFLDTYEPDKVFSSIDRQGRYAYANQPAIAQWNLARFAETLLPLIDTDEKKAIEAATESIERFTAEYDRQWLDGMRSKIGLATAQAGDLDLIQRLLTAMQNTAADYTQIFRALCSLCDPGSSATVDFCASGAQFDGWLKDWALRCEQEPAAPAERATRMRAVNPKYIPRNHRIEQMISAAVERGDYAPFRSLLAVLSRPFDEQPESSAYALAPQPQEQVLRTFCGT